MAASRSLGNYSTKNLHQEFLGVPPLDPKVVHWVITVLKNYTKNS